MRAHTVCCTPRYTSTVYLRKSSAQFVLRACTKTQCAHRAPGELVCAPGQAGAHWAPLGHRSPWIGSCCLAPALLRRFLIHAGEKPPKCTQCNYSSSVVTNLRKHTQKKAHWRKATGAASSPAEAQHRLLCAPDAPLSLHTSPFTLERNCTSARSAT